MKRQLPWLGHVIHMYRNDPALKVFWAVRVLNRIDVEEVQKDKDLTVLGISNWRPNVGMQRRLSISLDTDLSADSNTEARGSSFVLSASSSAKHYSGFLVANSNKYPMRR